MYGLLGLFARDAGWETWIGQATSAEPLGDWSCDDLKLGAGYRQPECQGVVKTWFIERDTAAVPLELPG